MFAVVGARVRTAARRVLRAVTTALQEALRPVPIATGLVRDFSFHTRKELIAENAALRQQLIVASRKVKRPVVRPPGDGQRWRTFLKNHSVWACDFLQVYDIWFRPLFAFFVLDVNTREVVHVAVTREPSERWTAQQLRQLTPFGDGPEFIIRDRDAKFGGTFDRVAKGAGLRVLKTAVQAPLMNATCERFLGSVRRECLDHVLVLGEDHLRSICGRGRRGRRRSGCDGGSSPDLHPIYSQ